MKPRTAQSLICISNNSIDQSLDAKQQLYHIIDSFFR